MPKPAASQEDEDPTPYLFVSLEQRRIDQSKPYDSKKNCWVPDEKEGYLLGDIKATKGDIVSVGLPGGEVMQSNQAEAPKTKKNQKKTNRKLRNVFKDPEKRLHRTKIVYYLLLSPNFGTTNAGALTTV